MKTSILNSSLVALRSTVTLRSGFVIHGRRTGLHLTLLSCMLSVGLPAANAGMVFSSPQEAVSALGQAVNSTNRAALETLFGPRGAELVNPDEIQGAAELSDFAAAFNSTNRLVSESDHVVVLEVGDDPWPFPIPLVKNSTGWTFDTDAGLDELLNRRIGRNELEVLSAMRAYVQAQREYASQDRDGDGVLEYAQKLASSPGRTDGLYWAPEVNGEISPLGPFFAEAQSEGYFASPQHPGATPEPFHGYFFKILTRQGKHAPGGKYDYLIHRNMIGGFAIVAWPAEYGASGVMTFIVNQQGTIYQRDLGKNTARIVRRMSAYDPDGGWQTSSD